MQRVRNTRVVVCHLTVPIRGMPAGMGKLRIAHVSDFHFRRWNRVHDAALDVLLALNYDLVAATGDFGVSSRHWARPAELTRRFFGPIAERAPVYAVLGNHDHPNLAESVDMPLIFLRNRSVSVQRAGAVVQLAGIDQLGRNRGEVASVLGRVRPDRPLILLAHYPSTVFRLPAGCVDLQLSGHTHGGQIRLPGLGCLWTNDRIPRQMSRGLHAAEGTFLHISAGIGVSWPIPMRINCPPQIDVLTLEPARDSALQTPARELEVAGTCGGFRASV